MRGPYPSATLKALLMIKSEQFVQSKHARLYTSLDEPGSLWVGLCFLGHTCLRQRWELYTDEQGPCEANARPDPPRHCGERVEPVVFELQAALLMAYTLGGWPALDAIIHEQRKKPGDLWY